MIYWHGKSYPLVKRPYNGSVLGYLLDGLLLGAPPKRTRIQGHIVTDEGVVIVLARDMRLALYIVCAIGAVLTILLWPRYEYSYYQVTFAEKPLLQDGILQCNVINEADREVTVQFIGTTSKTVIYTLSPGETLPYIYIDFVPKVIRYNGESDFQLEVQND